MACASHAFGNCNVSAFTEHKIRAAVEKRGSLPTAYDLTEIYHHQNALLLQSLIANRSVQSDTASPPNFSSELSHRHIDNVPRSTKDGINPVTFVLYGPLLRTAKCDHKPLTCNSSTYLGPRANRFHSLHALSAQRPWSHVSFIFIPSSPRLTTFESFVLSPKMGRTTT